MERPSPEPLPTSFVVKKGSNTRASTSRLIPVPVSDTVTNTVGSPSARFPASFPAGRSPVTRCRATPRGMAPRPRASGAGARARGARAGGGVAGAAGGQGSAGGENEIQDRAFEQRPVDEGGPGPSV